MVIWLGDVAEVEKDVLDFSIADLSAIRQYAIEAGATA